MKSFRGLATTKLLQTYEKFSKSNWQISENKTSENIYNKQQKADDEQYTTNTKWHRANTNDKQHTTTSTGVRNTAPTTTTT